MKAKEDSNVLFEEELEKHGIPLDEVELKIFREILKNQELFDRKFREYELRLEEICKKHSKDPHPASLGIQHEILKIAKHIFCKNLDNRPFCIPPLAPGSEIFIPNRNTPCEICKENRVIDICHIIPRRLGGTASLENTFFLCPSHHRLFDRGMLTVDEISKLNWLNKSFFVKQYFLRDVLPKCKKFEEKIKGEVFVKQTSVFRGTILSFESFIKNEIINILKDRKKKREEEILKHFCKSSVSIAEATLPLLYEMGVLYKDYDIYQLSVDVKFLEYEILPGERKKSTKDRRLHIEDDLCNLK
ncbi:hypothetical protein AAIR98_000890 [Elusimicrobium simillimum]|uniref:HNH endonuclease n=1 Tax=Elusimicrobium simillimum TaxID=3143438 RepID=UPI003C6FAF49